MTKANWEQVDSRTAVLQLNNDTNLPPSQKSRIIIKKLTYATAYSISIFIRNPRADNVIETTFTTTPPKLSSTPATWAYMQGLAEKKAMTTMQMLVEEMQTALAMLT